MRVVFMGTPEFAVPCFKKLNDAHQVVAVVTVPDKPAGRGRQLTASAIKEAALVAGIPVLQPESLKDPVFISELQALQADLFAVVAFRILPEVVFTMPPMGTVNLHASLLPHLRGAAPINWALINGDPRSGITTFFIEKQVDTGHILLQDEVSLGEDMTAGELHDLLSERGAELLLTTLNGIEAGTLQAQQQKGDVTLAPKLTRELCLIDWKQPAIKIHNLVRGLSPFPGAFTWLDQKQFKILRTRVQDESRQIMEQPGTIISSDKQECLVATGQGVIRLLEVKPEGKRAMDIEAFLRGHRLSVGEQFLDQPPS